MSPRLATALAVLSLSVISGCQAGEPSAPPAPSTAPAPAAQPSPSPPAPSAAPSAAPTAPPTPAADPPIIPVPVPNGPPIPGATPYARDIARICRVEELVAQDPGTAGSNPALVTAQYLAANLETTQARELMIKMTGSPEAERAGLLDAAAAEVGLTTGCPTARRWDKAAGVPE